MSSRYAWTLSKILPKRKRERGEDRSHTRPQCDPSNEKDRKQNPQMYLRGWIGSGSGFFLFVF